MTPFPSFASVLPALDTRRLCLPAFCSGGGHPDFIIGVLEACREAGSPAVLLIQHQRSEYYGFEAVLFMMREQGQRLKVPVIPFLDHCTDLGILKHALDCGVRSVMFDGSHMPLVENIEQTQRAAKLAHAAGALIEGELGFFNPEGSDEAPHVETEALTRVEEAVSFVKETGVDLLAPSVGNAHGLYTGPPWLRFELIEALAAQTDVCMSLHGGTGIPAADTLKAAAFGFRKINVATQLHQAYGATLSSHAPAIPWETRPNYSWQQTMAQGRASIREVALQLLLDLGCTRLV